MGVGHEAIDGDGLSSTLTTVITDSPDRRIDNGTLTLCTRPVCTLHRKKNIIRFTFSFSLISPLSVYIA